MISRGRITEGRCAHYGALAITLGIGACGGEGDPMPPGVTLDTLDNGAVLVQNSGPGAWAANGVQPWRLVEDLRIGSLDSQGPEMFAYVGDVIPDNRDRIWILDSGAFELRLFDSDGGFVRTVGGAGEGPGEFGFNPCASPGPDGEIWVESARRWQRFDTAGVLLGGQQVTRSLGCGATVWRGDEFFAASVDLEPGISDRSLLMIAHQRSPNGDVAPIDTIVVPPLPPSPTVSYSRSNGRPFVTRRLPLSHSAAFRLGPNGDGWWTDGGGAYDVRRQKLEGDTLLILRREYEPVPVPNDIRNAEIEALRREDLGWPDDFDREDVPRVFPPFDRIQEARDGSLWLRRQVEGGKYVFDVFDRDGIYLGQVETFDGFGDVFVFDITENHAYGRVEDELGVHYVVRWRIEKS